MNESISEWRTACHNVVAQAITDWWFSCAHLSSDLSVLLTSLAVGYVIHAQPWDAKAKWTTRMCACVVELFISVHYPPPSFRSADSPTSVWIECVTIPICWYLAALKLHSIHSIRAPTHLEICVGLIQLFLWRADCMVQFQGNIEPVPVWQSWVDSRPKVRKLTEVDQTFGWRYSQWQKWMLFFCLELEAVIPAV